MTDQDLLAGNSSPWIQTYTGKAFYLLNPRVEDICIEDIAHSLAYQCRFNGHTKDFYSIAQHSCLVSFCSGALFEREGLMHDAAETYVGDVTSPLKRLIPDFKRIEDRILEAIARKFGFSFPIPRKVKEVDLHLLSTEAQSLLTLPPMDWNVGFDPYRMEVVPVGPREAEKMFLNRFRAVFG